MKSLFYAALILTLLSCNEGNNVAEKKSQKPLFEFDELTLVRILISNEEFERISESKQRSEREEQLYTILTQPFPDDLNYNDFVNELRKQNNINCEIDKQYFKKLNEAIFVEKHCDDLAEGGCQPMYNNILIFMKNGQITGLAKLFFGCSMYEFTGTKADYSCFGASDEFDRLREILEKSCN